MDDNAESVKAMSAELGLSTIPWRLIAFFPDKIEDELAQEKLYGKSYGRETEDDIRETVFRVEDDYGRFDYRCCGRKGRKSNSSSRESGCAPPSRFVSADLPSCYGSMSRSARHQKACRLCSAASEIVRTVCSPPI